MKLARQGNHIHLLSIDFQVGNALSDLKVCFSMFLEVILDVGVARQTQVYVQMSLSVTHLAPEE